MKRLSPPLSNVLTALILGLVIGYSGEAKAQSLFESLQDAVRGMEQIGGALEGMPVSKPEPATQNESLNNQPADSWGASLGK